MTASKYKNNCSIQSTSSNQQTTHLQPTLSLFSPAKINLFLHIVAKRADGYHDLQTVFHLLDWGDTLDFSVSSKTFETVESFESSSSQLPMQSSIQSSMQLPIELHCEQMLTDKVQDNLIIKSAYCLLKWLRDNQDKAVIKPLPKTLPVIDVYLHKVLPTGAGLGGGSSNAATTLMALNTLWDLKLDTATLISIGKRIGADVPIFIFGQDAIAEGIGDRLTAINLPPQHYLVLNPDAHASTQALFTHPDLNRAVAPLSHAQICKQQNRYIACLQPPYQNVFEPVVSKMVAEVEDALYYLRQLEPITQTTARMTGSGSSVYLPIPAEHVSATEQYIIDSLPPCHAIMTTSYKANPL